MPTDSQITGEVATAMESPHVLCSEQNDILEEKSLKGYGNGGSGIGAFEYVEVTHSAKLHDPFAQSNVGWKGLAEAEAVPDCPLDRNGDEATSPYVRVPSRPESVPPLRRKGSFDYSVRSDDSIRTVDYHDIYRGQKEEKIKAVVDKYKKEKAAASRERRKDASVAKPETSKIGVEDPQRRRDTVRLLYAQKVPFPSSCVFTDNLNVRSTVSRRLKPTQFDIDQGGIHWSRGRKHKGSIVATDLIGAQIYPCKKGCRLLFHYFLPGKGKYLYQKVRRRPRILQAFANDEEQALKWQSAVRAAIDWYARVPFEVQRRLLVVVNPHSGRQKAMQTFQDKVKPFFDAAGIQYDIQQTERSRHAVDMGREFSLVNNYEAVVFVSGDGTVAEFLDGLLSQPEQKWREIVQAVPITLISAGTQNGLALGLGVPTIPAAVYSIIQRKNRPLDLIAATNADGREIRFSTCGIGWGIPGAVAADSERYRWMGTHRYLFLKLRHGLFTTRTSYKGRIEYVPADPQPALITYDRAALSDPEYSDQHITEWASTYNIMQQWQKEKELEGHENKGKLCTEANMDKPMHVAYDKSLGLEIDEDVESVQSETVINGPKGLQDDRAENLVDGENPTHLDGTSGMHSNDKAGPKKDSHLLAWQGPIEALLHPADKKKFDSSQWEVDEGAFVAVGALNVVNDAKYGWPSDGYLDYVVVKKGNILRTLQLACYLAVGKELNSPLVRYIKCKAVIIEPENKKDTLNIDGEVLAGPAPFRMEIVPSFLQVLSER